MSIIFTSTQSLCHSSLIHTAVGYWHSLAHVLSCLKQYSILRARGAGGYDGEGQERINARLRPAALILKESTKAAYYLRVDSIFDVINRQKRREQTRLLWERHEMLTKKYVHLSSRFSNLVAASTDTLETIRQKHTQSRLKLIPKIQTRLQVEEKRSYDNKDHLAEYMERLLRWRVLTQADVRYYCVSFVSIF